MIGSAVRDHKGIPGRVTGIVPTGAKGPGNTPLPRIEGWWLVKFKGEKGEAACHPDSLTATGIK